MIQFSEFRGRLHELVGRKNKTADAPSTVAPVDTETHSSESADLYKPSEFKGKLEDLLSEVTTRKDLDFARMSGYIERMTKALKLSELVKMKILEMDLEKPKLSVKDELEAIKRKRDRYIAFEGKENIDPRVIATWIGDSEKTIEGRWGWMQISAVQNEAGTKLEQGATKTIDIEGSRLTFGAYAETKAVHLYPKSAYSVNCEFPDKTPSPFTNVHFVESKVGTEMRRGIILRPKGSGLEIHITCNRGETPKGIIVNRKVILRYEPSPAESQIAEKLLAGVQEILTFENIQEQAMDAISQGIAKKV